MPRLTLRRKAARTSLSTEQWEELTDGALSLYYHGTTAFSNALQKRAAWIAHREALLAARTAEEDARGGRLSCWWLFDSPKEPRRIVGRRTPDPTTRVDDVRHRGEPIIESDIPYLIRHGLATAVEVAYLEGLREREAAMEKIDKWHPDELGPRTMRLADWAAYESAVDAT